MRFLLRITKRNKIECPRIQVCDISGTSIVLTNQLTFNLLRGYARGKHPVRSHICVYIYGPDIERDFYSPLYEEVLLDSLYRLNRGLPDDAIQDALFKLKNFENGELVQKNAVFMDYLQNGMRRRIVQILISYSRPPIVLKMIAKNAQLQKTRRTFRCSCHFLRRTLKMRRFFEIELLFKQILKWCFG